VNDEQPPKVHSASDHWRARGQLTEVNATTEPTAFDVIPFDPERHGAMIQAWAGERGLAVPLDHLPRGGRIVEDLAVGFMYRTDSKVAILEGLVANPEASAQYRDVAIDRIIGALFDMVRADGYDLVWAWTAHPAVVERCLKLGFKEGPGARTFGSRRV